MRRDRVRALLEELSAARRVLVHGRVAEAMEALYGLDNQDYLTQIAEQYAESAVLNEAHARRVADLTVYLRQHHAERDLAADGRGATQIRKGGFEEISRLVFLLLISVDLR